MHRTPVTATLGLNPRGLPSNSRWTAHFTPEVWVDDYAVEIDADGPQTWDCTDYARDRVTYLASLVARETDRLAADADKGGQGVVDRDDVFLNDPAAPQWIREHRGPFTIRLTHTIRP